MGASGMVATGSPGPVMLQSLVEGVRIVVSERPLTDAEWEEQVRIALAWVPQTSGVIVVTEGSGLTSKQRSMYAKHQSLLSQPTAIVSSSAVMRGIVTAMSWLGAKHQAFSPQRMDLAFEFLGVPPATRQRVLREIEVMQGKLHEVMPDGVGHAG
jgi:hypothetical protein